MTLALYMDHHVQSAITRGVRARGIDVLTALEDGTTRLNDPALLDRATALGRVLFSRDVDLLVEAARRQHAGESFAGLIYPHQVHVSIGQCVRDLELLALLEEPADLMNRVEYLPL